MGVKATITVAAPTFAVYRRALFTLALMVVLGIAASRPQAAETADGDIFIPDDLHFYNPLEHSDGSRIANYNTIMVGLDNESLVQAAAQYRNNDMDATQRALNYQWLLQQHHNHEGVVHGSKVLSTILKMGFRTYWNLLQKNAFSNSKVVPNADGEVDLGTEMTYDVKISGDELKLSFEYEF